MKRKEFLNRLLKISELHQSLNPIREIALVANKGSHKKEKEPIPEPRIIRMVPIETTNNYSPQSLIKHRQNTVIKKQLRTSKVLIHTKEFNSSYYRIPSRRRMKTTPTHSKLNSSQAEELSKLLEDNYTTDSHYEQTQTKKYQHIKGHLNISDALPHYLQIRQIQPKAFPCKANPKINQLKRASTKNNQIPRASRMKKHSLTEPAEVSKKQSNTERKMEIQCSKIETNPHNHASIRSDSFKKHRQNSQFATKQQKNQQNRTKLNAKKELNRIYTKHFMPPPKLTAKSYIIYQIKERKEQSKVIVAFNSKNSQQVASLTKIMTCILTIKICQQLSVNREKEQIIIGRLESNVGGTTASLTQGEIYTVQQLLYGLMLPSGNDASMALAIWAGRKLLQKEQETQPNNEIKNKFVKMECYNRFILQMNSKAKELGMNKSNYANSHGLMNPNNKSSAYDITILCEYAMRNETFRKIVRCKSYKSLIRFIQGQDYKRNQEKFYRNEFEDGSTTDISENEKKSPPKINTSLTISNKFKAEKTKTIEWQNTHKLLHLKPKQYLGIKTGYTYSAGPCLSSLISINDRNFIIIVLGCSRVNLRFKQTEILRKWLVKHENLKKKKLKKTESQLISDQQQELEEEQVEFILENMKADEETED